MDGLPAPRRGVRRRTKQGSGSGIVMTRRIRRRGRRVYDTAAGLAGDNAGGGTRPEVGRRRWATRGARYAPALRTGCGPPPGTPASASSAGTHQVRSCWPPRVTRGVNAKTTTTDRGQPRRARPRRRTRRPSLARRAARVNFLVKTASGRPAGTATHSPTLTRQSGAPSDRARRGPVVAAEFHRLPEPGHGQPRQRLPPGRCLHDGGGEEPRAVAPQQVRGLVREKRALLGRREIAKRADRHADLARADGARDGQAAAARERDAPRHAGARQNRLALAAKRAGHQDTAPPRHAPPAQPAAQRRTAARHRWPRPRHTPHGRHRRRRLQAGGMRF